MQRNDKKKIPIKNSVALVVSAAFFALTLAVIISQLLKWAAIGVNDDRWFSSALFHTFLSFLIIMSWRIQGQLRQKMFGWKRWGLTGNNCKSCPYFLEISSLFLVIGSLGLVIVSQKISPYSFITEVDFPWSYVIWVPLVEEICYRGFLGALFVRLFGGFVGVWFSSVLFAMVHVDFSLSEIVSGHFGIPLGPFLLGLFCMAGYYGTQSLLGAVLFHASANGTVYIFSSFDPRWLDWLEYLYL